MALSLSDQINPNMAKALSNCATILPDPYQLSPYFQQSAKSTAFWIAFGHPVLCSLRLSSLRHHAATAGAKVQGPMTDAKNVDRPVAPPLRSAIMTRYAQTELVIFDCDGVLIDSEVISARMLIAELADYGVALDMAFVSRYFLGRSYPAVLAEVRTRFGITLPDQFEADYRARLLAAFQRDLKVMPGVQGCIAQLALPFCLATSSSPERVRQSLALTGLAPLFGDRVYTASRVARGKPAPDLFLFAAAEMGTSPQRCIVIEDSLNGVTAGLAAGMEVWRFTGGSHLKGLDLTAPPEARAHREFGSFAEFFIPCPELQRRQSAVGAP